jgi:hypothetical protein
MASRIPNGGGTVKLNFKGMGELLKSNEIGNMLVMRMAKVQAALPGSTLERKMRPTRVAYIVKRGSDFDEANTGDLSRALDLAGGQRGTKTNFGEAARKAKAKGGR